MIIIPMAGLSSRFTKAGYNKPKYMLNAFDKTIFDFSVSSFEKYFHIEHFLFIALNLSEFDVESFIHEKAQSLSINSYEVIIINKPTRGQAETVYLGLKNSSISLHEPITIFNIDTFRPNFQYPNEFDIDNVDGYLETFIGEGENWSNVVPIEEGSNKVQFTAEKQQVSQYCCTGLYYFKSVELFNRTYEEYIELNLTSMGITEFYIAPMYNLLIETGKNVHFSVIDKDSVIFCGIPAEYESFLQLRRSY